MSKFSFLPVLCLNASIAWAQSVSPAPGDTSKTVADPDHAIALDRIVVTGNPDARSVFELAQGASILAGDNLRKTQQSTLGETLATTPGVNATYYGPGASRPIIRGLGGDRVRMLDNGIGSLDASNISPDHNVSVEPLLVESIEVLRGPASLLYGSSAVGGVVNVIDNRIPDAAPDAPISGRAEVRYGSAANERSAVTALTAGNERFALQINALNTESDDLSIPGFADPAQPADPGTLPNTALTTRSESIGATSFWTTGHAGAAVSEYHTVYGVPGGEPIHINMTQRRADLRAAITEPFAFFKSAQVRFGLADYQHAEIDNETGVTNTGFHNHAWEGRLELVQKPFGALTGTLGVQTTRSNFSALGEEVVTPPSVTTSQALFFLESVRLNPQLTAHVGARYERQNVKLGDVPTDLPTYPDYAATSAESRTDHALSLSTGAVWLPSRNYSLALSAAYSERNPTAQERFSNGPHGGTGSYEIGSSSLGQERSVGLDLTLRKRTGFVSGSVGLFLNRFQNYIFEQRDPLHYFDENSGAFLDYPAPPDAEYLPIYQFVARDAEFYGAEAEVSLHLIDSTTDHLHLDFTADRVRAQQTTDHQPLPRTPPSRIATALRYRHGPWDLGVSAHHAFAQTRLAPDETGTASYTLLGAEVAYRFFVHESEWDVSLQGSNLSDEEARVSTSFLKDVAPLPGRNVTLSLRTSF